MSYDWKVFAGTEGELPPQRRYVLVQVRSEVPYADSNPPTVSVGYLKFAAGDEDCPYFVTPGVGGHPTHWCDCLGDDFTAPLWPGTNDHPNRRHK